MPDKCTFPSASSARLRHKEHGDGVELPDRDDLSFCAASGSYSPLPMSSVLINVRVMNANLSAEIRRLSSAEKIQLAEEIWDQVAEAAQALPVPKAHQAELDRRLATTAGEVGRPWTEVRDELRRR